MSGTRRTPLTRRPALARITPVALEAFRKIQTLEETPCTCLRGREGECPACTEWWDAQSTIHRELACRPWNFPPCEYEGMGAWPPNEEARALWRLFEEATRLAGRGHRKRARRAETEPAA